MADTNGDDDQAVVLDIDEEAMVADAIALISREVSGHTAASGPQIRQLAEVVEGGRDPLSNRLVELFE